MYYNTKGGARIRELRIAKNFTQDDLAEHMHSKKTVLIVDLMNAANTELIRLDFRSSALSRHDKEFRRFCNYCTENGIQTYDAETGPRYFRSRFGLNIGDANIKLNRQQLDARNHGVEHPHGHAIDAVQHAINAEANHPLLAPGL